MTHPAIGLLPYSTLSPLLEEALAVYAPVWPDRDPGDAREGFARYATYRDFHGLVSRLHDALLAAQPCPRALVCTGHDNSIARGKYERRGWNYVDMCLLEPETGHRYVIMEIATP
ncbi:MAG TPA: hypothetical protein VMM78_02365 [Thermomicrobiales bacterium]|nr:hypothetical protein [Thermomicrobiales bacterium]